MSEQPAVEVLGLGREGRDNAVGGAAAGPGMIRWGLESAETHSLWQRRNLPPWRDNGDRYLYDRTPDGAVEAMAEAITEAASGAPLLVLGGDHLVSLPAVRHNLRRHPGLRVVHLDAHLDQRDRHEGERLSHATVMRRIDELAKGPRVASFGVRSRAPEEAWENERFFARQVAAPLARWLEGPGRSAPLYLSVDLDVLDPGLMPAVSNPEPGGIGMAELVEAFKLLRGRLVGADLVELVPTATTPAASAQVAGVVMRELMIALAG